MTLTAADLGILGNLATALGFLRSDGTPDPTWLAAPEASLRTVLTDDGQREALVAFVDEALGGADRTEQDGVTWLPVLGVEDPALDVYVTLDDRTDPVAVGVAVAVRTTSPASRTTLSLPLFRADADDPLLLGRAGARLRLATEITVDGSAPVPGEAHLAAVGLDLEVPTAAGDGPPTFGLTLSGLQLPGATTPTDLHVSGTDAAGLDDVLLDLLLGLVRAQAEAVGAGAFVDLAGLLGLGGGAVPPVPVDALVTDGAVALAGWLRGLLDTPSSREAWLDHLAGLLGGARAGDEVVLDLSPAEVRLGLRVDTGPSGNPRLTPTLRVLTGGTAARAEAVADVCEVDLVTGTAVALPALGVWASVGSAASPVLDVSEPEVARAETLRLGFALDAARRLTLVLAADVVRLGTRDYPTLDLTSADAVMDAAGAALEDVAESLLGSLGDALPAVRRVLGADPPTGHPAVPTVPLAELLTDPLAAVASYWRTLLSDHRDAVTAVLDEVRDLLADLGAVPDVTVVGEGTLAEPWQVPLVGPVTLDVVEQDGVLRIDVAVRTSVDTLAQRCTVLQTRLAATLAEIDLGVRSVSLLPAVQGRLTAHARGSDPPSVVLPLGSDVTVTAGPLGLVLAWSAAGGLTASAEVPDLVLHLGDVTVPVPLPQVGADGSVTLPPEAWDAVQELVGHLAALLPPTVREVVAALGWAPGVPFQTGARPPVLRLADLIADAPSALAGWLPGAVLGGLAPRGVALLADLLGAVGPVTGPLLGSGHPDDPYRLPLGPGPQPAVWFPPAGLEPVVTAVPHALRRWEAGSPALPTETLEAALRAEAAVDAQVAALVRGRSLAAGLAALVERWTGGDGLAAPPLAPPAGITLVRTHAAAGQLLDRVDLETELGREPAVVVHVAVGPDAWPDAPAGRRVDLTAAGLAPAMLAVPDAALGGWFVALGSRTACRLDSDDADGTEGQAARLARVLDSLAPLGEAITVVAVGGAGHAARVAADRQPAVTDLLLVGTPLQGVSLSALSTQPAADALRLLHHLLPLRSSGAGTGGTGGAGAAEDADLALGRSLVETMVALTPLVDPAADLRPPTTDLPAVRAGLTVTAFLGELPEPQVARAVTAVVAAGLAERALTRSAAPPPPPTGVHAGLVLPVLAGSGGSLLVEGDARLTAARYDVTTGEGGVDLGCSLRARLWVSDRLGWLVATPEAELRMVSVDVTVPLGAGGTGQALVVLHDARVLGQSWERLVVAPEPVGLPLLPEARLLLASAVQRLVGDAAANPVSQAAVGLAEALGLVVAGGAVHDAFEQLVLDPAALVASARSRAPAELAAAVAALLGPAAGTVDLAAGVVTVSASSPGGAGGGPGRHTWAVDATVSGATSGTTPVLGGTVTIGHGAPAVGDSVQLVVALSPLSVSLHWHHAGGAVEAVPLWPSPDGSALAVLLARVAPSLAGQVGLELLRAADEAARSVVDAALEAFGLLTGAAGDLERQVRPLAGLLADPGGWLRASGGLSSTGAQAMLDAVRPLLGVAGSVGEPLPLASGVELAVRPDADGCRLELTVDAAAFGPAPAGSPRLAGGLVAALVLRPGAAPSVSLAAYVGLPGAEPGRSAVHVTVGATSSATGTGVGTGVFLRPAAGADIPLVPFVGFGSLASAAAAALPYLLDRLAEVEGEVGTAVGTVGDALGLRAGPPSDRSFDAAALSAWAVDPVAALTLALPSLLSTGLTALAPAVDALLPAAVSVTATPTALSATVEGVAVTWAPAERAVTVTGDGIAVPGVETVGFEATVSSSGLDVVTVTIGPAQLDAGGAVLRPYVHVTAGLALPGGAGVAVGLATGATQRLAARWLLSPPSFALVTDDGSEVTLGTGTDPIAVATRSVEAVLDLVAAVAMASDAVSELLDFAVGASTVRDLLQDVLIDGDDLLDGAFDPATLPDRVVALLGNLGQAAPSVTVDGLTLSLLERDEVVGLQVGLAQRLELASGEVTLWLENDDSWITGGGPGDGGVFVGVVSTAGTLAFAPTLSVDGVGLRVGSVTGPLLDTVVTLESLALHVFAAIGPGGVTGAGAQVQLSGLAVAASGAAGGNGIAAGIVADTGPTPPQPSFSPALAVQSHGGGPVAVTLRAGAGDGPWWVAIQQGFGPLYLEQVGFGVEMPADRLESVSLFLDGSVSLFGLTCAVDDLQISYLVSKNDLFNPASWEIDLAGLAVTADMSGVTIAGGLLKNVSPTGDVEYLGMLLGRFGVYGITIYGGYGEGTDGAERFVAFFAVGAVVGPIGGPPAFFLTGIGGGFGINRALVVPADLSAFGDYPLVQALDTAASPGNPMDQLRALGEYFPAERGTFWFAAGLSFTSFVIVDGIAVVAVEVGDGLDVNLLGLARMALPRPEVALVSIELALLVRFSSSEGVLWVQGQLTDNSYLLYRDVKLTGGFAYVIWFAGPNAGQFVLTMGGYHPDFSRPGYPVVPRLGMTWRVSSAIVVKAGGYFALTSEAVMAGGDFEASADFGPAWAEVRFGAHGIVFFDPFHYSVEVYASIAAGVTIDTWLFGEVTFSISIGARIQVEGPDFHGRATFEVGPCELEVEFGSAAKHVDPPLSAGAFVDKYLDPAPGGGADALAVVTTFGVQPSGSGAPTPDGGPDRPYVVTVEFGLIVTTVVPASRRTHQTLTGSGPVSVPASHPPSRALGVAPMDAGAMDPTIDLRWVLAGAPESSVQTFPFSVTARPFGSFPVGVWGPPQDDDNRPLPKGDVIEALSELELSATAVVGAGGPEIAYYQVETGPRRPLPFTRTAQDAEGVRQAGTRLGALVPRVTDVDAAFAAASRFLSSTASRTALAALRGERQAPPLLGTLGEGLDALTATEIPSILQRPVPVPVDRSVRPAEAIALLPASGAVALSDASRAGARRRTTVHDASRLPRVPTPTLASVEAGRLGSVAAGLVVVEPPAATAAVVPGTPASLVARGDVPPTEVARARTALVARHGGGSQGFLAAFSSALQEGSGRFERVGAAAEVGPGDVAVLRLPNADRDVDPDEARPVLAVEGAGARVVVLGLGGQVTDDREVTDRWTLPRGCERVVVVGRGEQDGRGALSRSGLSGWHAGSQLPYVGWSTALGAGCTVRSRGAGVRRHRQRARAGWVTGAELARGTSTVTTRFAAAVRTVVVVLDDRGAFEDAADAGRELVLLLTGASRASAPDGSSRPPTVLAGESRVVLSYDVVPQPAGEGGRRPGPVEVTVLSEEGWSLAGVLASEQLTAEDALALVSVRGLDSATEPVAQGSSGTTRLSWLPAEGSG